MSGYALCVGTYEKGLLAGGAHLWEVACLWRWDGWGKDKLSLNSCSANTCISVCLFMKNTSDTSFVGPMRPEGGR